MLSAAGLANFYNIAHLSEEEIIAYIRYGQYGT